MQEKLLKKLGGILGAAFGNPFSSEELFIVIGCFSIFTHLSTPQGRSDNYLPSFPLLRCRCICAKKDYISASSRSALPSGLAETLIVDWKRFTWVSNLANVQKPGAVLIDLGAVSLGGCPVSAGLGRVGLGWVGLACVGMGAGGFGWVGFGLGWAGSGQVGLAWVGSDWVGLDWLGFVWLRLGWGWDRAHSYTHAHMHARRHACLYACLSGWRGW